MIITIAVVMTIIAIVVAGIALLIRRRRRKIEAGEPVWHFKKVNGTRWY